MITEKKEMEIKEISSKVRDLLDECFCDIEYMISINRLTQDKLDEVRSPDRAIKCKEIEPWMRLYQAQYNIDDYISLQHICMNQIIELEEKLKKALNLLHSVEEKSTL